MSTKPGQAQFTAVEAQLRQFIDFDEERLYTLVALWIIGTYLYSMFSHYGYLVFYSAFPRSGKTRTLEIFSHLAFEATQPLNAPTPPTIRETAMEGRTLLLDTLERWREKNAEAFSAAMDLLDAGFRNGGMVVKMVPRDAGGWRKESFLVYAPYAMAAIDKDSLTDTALDRAFVVEMHRKSVKVKKRKYTYFSCDKDCRPIRENLYIWALQNAERVASVYESAEQELSVNGLGLNDRAADIWKPLFALAQVLSLDNGIIDSFKRLATDMGGDAESVDDQRKLEVVLGAHSGHRDRSVRSS